MTEMDKCVIIMHWTLFDLPEVLPLNKNSERPAKTLDSIPMVKMLMGVVLIKNV